MHFFNKVQSGMTYSEDPDQTAPLGAVKSGLYCLHMPFCQTYLKIIERVAKSIDPIQTLYSVASDLGFHCLIKPVCPST